MNRPTMLDVTKARTSPRWLDADGYKLARLYRCIRGQRQGFLKGHAIRNDMIGRKHDHRGPVIAGRHPTSAQRDCRSGTSYAVFCLKKKKARKPRRNLPKRFARTCQTSDSNSTGSKPRSARSTNGARPTTM